LGHIEDISFVHVFRMGVRSCAAWCRAVLSVLLVELAVFEQAEAHKADGVRDVSLWGLGECVGAAAVERLTFEVVYIIVRQVMIWAHSASAVGTLHATLRKTITYSRPVHLVRTTAITQRGRTGGGARSGSSDNW
jgi:hypothetical protein